MGPTARRQRLLAAVSAASVSAAAKGEVEMAPPCFEEVLPTRGRPHGRPSGLVKSLGADDLPTGGISMSASSRAEHTMRKAGMDHSGFACT